MAKQNHNVRKEELNTTATTEDVANTTAEAAECSSMTHVECAAQEEAAGTEPKKSVFSKACGAVKKSVYSSVYTVTYGVVYSALVVGDLIPTNNIVGEGMRDGFTAAKKAYGSRSEKLAVDDSVAAMNAAATPA